MIESYWRYLGCPISRCTGYLADLVPWPISEALLWWGIASWLLFPFAHKNLWSWSIKSFLLLGMLSLLVQAFSQGASPVDFVPTVFRDHPTSRLPVVKVEKQNFETWIEQAQLQLMVMPEKVYSDLPEEPELTKVYSALAEVLQELNYPVGREVRRVKSMSGLSRCLGLAYGGPAYHDVLTGEVVLASPMDYPSTKLWRWCTVVHEVAHAQGFTREMDAEILTWLALKKLGPMGSYFSSALALSKTGRELKWPEFLEQEMMGVLAQRKALNQPVVYFLRKLSKALGLQNTGGKYGSLAEGQDIPNEKHEFFGVVLGVEKLNL